MDKYSGDILQPLRDDDIPKYLEICKLNFPFALRAHHFLLLQSKWKAYCKQPENQGIAESITPKYNYYIYVQKRVL